MTFLTLQRLAELLSGEVIPARSEASTSIPLSSNSIDSRTLNPGDLFWALPGSQHDGHEFVAEAFRRGACGAVVSRRITGVSGPLILVADVLTALQTLAVIHRGQQDALMIGLTGSVGKTSTRHMLHAVLSQNYCGTQSLQNYNNQLGVPLSLLTLEESHEFGVFELGASAPGDIAVLAEMVQPEIGILTQIGPAHLESFGSLEKVIQTKAELLAALPESGFAILPETIALLPGVRSQIGCSVITVGQSETCHVQANNIRLKSQTLEFHVENKEYSLAASGKHFLNSALICIAVARELGLSASQIQAGLSLFRPLSGRCCVRQIGSWSVIDDSYNASPLSVQAGLETLSGFQNAPQRIAVLGDMLCLGDQSAFYHRKVGQAAARSDVDHLLVYGQFAHEVAQGALRAGMSGSRIGVFQTLEQLQEILSLWLTPHAALLLKASRNMQLERLLPWLEAEAQEEAALEPAFYRRAS